MKRLLLIVLLLVAGCSTEPVNTNKQPDLILSAAKTCPICPVVAPVQCPPITIPTGTTNPPVVVTAGSLQALDSFNHPDQDTTNWKTNISRQVFKNQTTGFVIKGDLCLLQGKAQKLLPVNIVNSSAKQYKKGLYYDAMVPLTALNCPDAKYAWLDLNESYSGHGLSINIIKKEAESLLPKVPLMVQLDPYNYTKGINKGVYKDNTEPLALDALKVLTEHRLQPMKSWVVPYNEYSGTYGFDKYVQAFSKQFTSVPMNGNLGLLNSDVTKYKIDRPWFYVVDEPDATAINIAKTTLQNLKVSVPNVSRLITTTFKDGLDVDIYCPVMEQLGNGYPERSKYNRLCLYISCMSNGCGENRAWTGGKFNHIDYDRTGTPDLAIDAPLSDSFGFYEQGIVNKVDFLLYYNSIEQWSLKGVNPVEDTYNFGANGDGTLLYPDYDNLKPLQSLRLKMLREASFWADAVIMSDSESVIKTNVRSTKDWSFNYSDRESIYSKLK